MNIYLAILFWLHLLGMSIWVGGSLLLPLVIVPALQALEPPARGKFMAAFSKRLASWVMGSIVVVVITGILQAGTVYKTYAVLWGYPVLVIKIIVALLMAANGTYLGMGLSRRSAALAPAPGASPSPEFLKIQAQIGRHSLLQAVLSVVVLFLVGLLTAG